MMRVNKEQRVGVFVDVQNLYYSAKNLYNAKVNFAQVLRMAVRGRRLVRAITYAIKADIKEEKNLLCPNCNKHTLTKITTNFII